MGKASMTFRELRFIFEDELTQVYVLIEAHGDCTIGVQGWHHKTFPSSRSVVDILGNFLLADDPVLWAQKAP